MPPKRSKSTGSAVLPSTPKAGKKTSFIDELPPELAEFALRRSERIKYAAPRTPGENKRRATSPILTSPARAIPNKKARDEEVEEKNPEDYADYVAEIPELQVQYIGEDRDELVWTWNPSDAEIIMVEQYLSRMKEKHGTDKDRSLYVLKQNDYNIDAAEEVIGSYVFPCSPQWNKRDSELFRRGFHMYGKKFRKISDLIPDKPMPEIIHHYYDTKKTDNLSKVAKSIPADEVDFGDSDDDGPTSRGFCFVCTKKTYLYHTEGLPICKQCKLYKDVMGEYDDNIDFDAVIYRRDPKNLFMPAHGEFQSAAMGISAGIKMKMFDPISQEEFQQRKEEEVERVTANVIRHNETSARKVDMDVVFAKKRPAHGFFFLNQEKPPTRCATESMAIKVKATETMLRCKTLEGGMDLDMTSDVALAKVEEIKTRLNKSLKQYVKNKEVKVSDEWSAMEKLVAAKAFGKYGFDFDKIAGVIETKTAEDVKAFYDHNRDHFEEMASIRAQKIKEKADQAAQQLKNNSA